MPRPTFRAKNIQARLRIDPRSLAEHNRKLKRLEGVTRREVVEAALLAGGGLIKSAANQKAPGPDIVMEVMTGAELMRGWRSGGAQGIKPEALYVAIGPDKQHWHYRFSEFGVKAHSVKRRKRTRYQQHLRKGGVSISKARNYRTGAKQSRTTGQTRPSMVFTIDGKLIFARKVKGFAAKPFLRPAADSQGPAAIQALGKELAREIEKVARS